MYLENVVFDARDPRRLGGFYEQLVGGERLTDEPAGFETRLTVAGGPELDLCFQPVGEPATGPPRLQLVLADAVEGRVDPEGNPLLDVADSSAYDGSGPLAALRLASADPEGDAGFWAWLTGWTAVSPRSLRHPSLRGPVLELVEEQAPKGDGKNSRHLDVRLEGHDDAEGVAAEVLARGGRELVVDWGDLPWRSYLDPSGNEFCLLPARS